MEEQVPDCRTVTWLSFHAAMKESGDVNGVLEIPLGKVKSD